VKICIGCHNRFDSPFWNCPFCGLQPERTATHIRLAPTAAQSSLGFEANFFGDLVRVEAGNFWFRNRNRLIQWALRKYFPEARSLLEIGCGTGFVLSGIEAAFPDFSLSGTEVFDEGLAIAATRLKAASLYQMDARAIPFDNEFDVIGAFDVLEHIEDDRLVLGEMYRAVRPGGGIILTVPQHGWLWSKGDEYAHHHRRYTRRDLCEKVIAAGFRVARTTSFVTLLLPLMLVARRTSKGSAYDPNAEFNIRPWQNEILERILAVERLAIRYSLSFPLGGSLLLVAYR